MTPGMNDDAMTSELSFDELDAVAGGFSFGGLLKAIIGGAASGGPAGPVGGGIFGGIKYILGEIF